MQQRHHHLLLLFYLLALCSLLFTSVHSVDQSKFRKCSQTSFCRRNRKAGNSEDTNKNNPLSSSLTIDSVTIASNDKTVLQLSLSSEDGTRDGTPFTGTFSYYPSLSQARLHITEAESKRWIAPDILHDQSKEATLCEWEELEEQKKFQCLDSDLTLEIINSVAFKVYSNNVLLFTLDSLYFEHWRPRATAAPVTTTSTSSTEEEDSDIHGGKKVVDYGEDGLAIYEDGTTQQKYKSSADDTDSTGLWEESFASHTDSKPNGPASVGLDITFESFNNVYGIPEHASDFNLKSTTTRGSEDDGGYDEPYRLYNLDVFEYDLDVPMALYGSIPVMLGHNTKRTSAVFWNNPTETFIDITKNEKKFVKTQWMSESSVIDVFMFLGPSISSILNSYTSLTGRPSLPPVWALGYHQCRWNYKSQEDVAAVNANFESHQIPYDVLWLDIEHTDGKRYFTWDSNLFSDPVAMQQNISYYGRKMVTIVDPHLKVDANYDVHTSASANNHYVKKADGVTDYDGWCWPGSSSYVDFVCSPLARAWWASQFVSYDKSTVDLYTWNDMNEPSVFNGPEITMTKDLRSSDGSVEHREWHNLYGMYMHRATMEGQILSKNKRPFVLSRAFAAGSQQYGAIWTGDNVASWEHLQYATKMLLSMSSVSLVFVGADVGGFFGNPSVELLTRWYQMALYQPFFRGHAHHDAARREPYLAEEPYRSFITDAIKTRYRILPYLYSLFVNANVTGMAVMRPLWFEFPSDSETFALDNVFMLGPSLLIHPITSPDVGSVNVYLPPSSLWYDRRNNHNQMVQSSSGETKVGMDSIPVYQRGGSVVIEKRRTRRSSELMKSDPYTLVIALDDNNEAVESSLYIEGYSSSPVTLSYKDSHTLSCKNNNDDASITALIERIEIYGTKNLPTLCSVSSSNITTTTTTSSNSITLKVISHKLYLSSNWTIQCS